MLAPGYEILNNHSEALQSKIVLTLCGRKH